MGDFNGLRFPSRSAKARRELERKKRPDENHPSARPQQDILL
jgi:hypothetical protein